MTNWDLMESRLDAVDTGIEGVRLILISGELHRKTRLVRQV